jgi:vacuolar protein sorting-associated protein 26
MTAFFAFGGTPVDVEIKLQGEEDRRQVEVKGEKDKKDMCPVYYDGESVVGTVCPITRCRGLWQRLTFR